MTDMPADGWKTADVLDAEAGLAAAAERARVILDDAEAALRAEPREIPEDTRGSADTDTDGPDDDGDIGEVVVLYDA